MVMSISFRVTREVDFQPICFQAAKGIDDLDMARLSEKQASWILSVSYMSLSVSSFNRV